MMLGKAGLLGMIGKAERGEAAIESIRNHKSCYLIAVGGAAFLVSKAIKSAKVLAFEDLGMEAIYEFEVDEMPVTVAVDSNWRFGSPFRTEDMAQQTGSQRTRTGLKSCRSELIRE